MLQFLAHLEDARGCSVQTRNLRLTAICSFARFVGSRSPEHVEWCTQIRALPRKKAAPKPISYLEKSEIDALLDAPSRATRQGHVTVLCCCSSTTPASGRLRPRS